MTQTLHLKAPENWINDPNGFIYYKGQYHLFYQHYPYEPHWGTMHWGHAVSDDLVTWEHQGIALFPSVPEDRNGCFSGSAVEDGGKLVLFYTGIRCDRETGDVRDPVEGSFTSVQLSISSEDGFRFNNEHEKRVVVPAITDPIRGDRMHTRDPKVWRGKDAWYMVLGSTTEQDGGKLLFYRSEDLTEWRFMDEASNTGRWGWMWECPDCYFVDGRPVLMFSPIGLMDSEELYGNNAICMLPEFDEETCRMTLPENYTFLDYGLDLYAPQSTVDADGRRVLVGWMRMPEPVAGKWNGMFCMPRVVDVVDDHIYFRLHPNLKQAFSRPIASPAEASPSGYHLELSLKEGEEISIGGFRVSRKDGKVCTDRSDVFRTDAPIRRKCETPRLSDGDRLDIYVEPNLIEIYANDGEYVLSNIVYGLTPALKIPEGIDYTLMSL